MNKWAEWAMMGFFAGIGWAFGQVIFDWLRSLL